jgi:protease-4
MSLNFKNFRGNWFIDSDYANAMSLVVFDLLSQKKPSLLNYKTDVNINKQSVSGSSPSGPQKVALIEIKHPILKYDDRWMGVVGTSTIVSLIDKINQDDQYLGAVFDVDSGGGQSYGTPLLFEAIKNSKKPIGVFTNGVMASAAYYGFAAADVIIADPRAEAIGSLGAYTYVVDTSGILKKYGGNIHKFYASKSDEKNYEHEQVLEGNYEPYIKKILDPLVDTFHADVISVRPNISPDTLRGNTYNGVKSLEMGLVDKLGTLEDTINHVVTLAINNNHNSINMAKERPQLQTLLGLDSPLEEMDGYSSISSEDIDSIEQSLENSNNELIKARENLTGQQTQLNDLETSVNAIITSHNIEVETTATLSEKITAVNTHISDLTAKLGGKDGAEITRPIADPDETDGEGNIIDNTASHNRLAELINN